MKKEYCCQKLKELYEDERDIVFANNADWENDEYGWHICGCSQCYAATYIKYCPWCGKELPTDDETWKD